MPPLILVQNDGEFTLVRRRGRFAIAREAAASERHLDTAANRMMNLMVEGLTKYGYEFVGPDFEIQGPVPHIEISEDCTPDLGPEAAPDPRDVEANTRFARAEQARRAKKVGAEAEDLVDFFLIARFKRRRMPTFRTAGIPILSPGLSAA